MRPERQSPKKVRPGSLRLETWMEAEPIGVHSRKFASFAFSNRSNPTAREEPARARSDPRFIRVIRVIRVPIGSNSAPSRQ